VQGNIIEREPSKHKVRNFILFLKALKIAVILLSSFTKRNIVFLTCHLLLEMLFATILDPFATMFATKIITNNICNRK
jgi:hypothetical protein